MELYNNGQTAAALEAGKAVLLEVIPDAAAIVAMDYAVPTLIQTTVAVGIGSAVAGMTLSAGALLVTSVVVTVGLSAAVAMGANKLSKVIVDVAEKHF